MKHSEEFIALAEAARKKVNELSLEQAQEHVRNGAVLVDVREDSEWQAGHARDAVHMSRGILERDIVQAYPDKNTEFVLYCGGGYRSVLAGESIQKMGYKNVHSMIGGWKAWKEAKLPIDTD